MSKQRVGYKWEWGVNGSGQASGGVSGHSEQIQRDRWRGEWMWSRSGGVSRSRWASRRESGSRWASRGAIRCGGVSRSRGMSGSGRVCGSGWVIRGGQKWSGKWTGEWTQ